MTTEKGGEPDLNVLLCVSCEDTGTVCEEHPYLPWSGTSDSRAACNCGGAGMPCPKCCSLVPENGRYSVLEPFIPDKFRNT